MPNQTSFRHIRMTINGHELEAWADEDPPVEFEAIDMIETTFGRDGALYAHDRAMLGGEVSVTLLPTSRSAVQIIRWFGQRQNDARLTFSGTYQDTAAGYALRLEGGILKQCDPTIVPGKNFEATFVFERFVPEVDGVTFDPPPAQASA